MKKKMFYIIFCLIILNFSVIFAQEVEVDTDFDVDMDNVIIDRVTDGGNFTQLDSNLPENGVNSITFDRIKTEEEFIFQTFIMDKLLKSNRILY